MTRLMTVALILLVASCAFDSGPAVEVPLTAESDTSAPLTTDLGWEVTLGEARLSIRRVEFLAGDDPDDGAKIGERIANAAVDLLAGPQALGRAIFQPGSKATQALVDVGPPAAGAAGAAAMHGAGLYFAGTAVPPGGGDAVPFTAALPVDAPIGVADLDLDADSLPALVLHIQRDGWFDGIDFAALPGGVIEDGSAEAETIKGRLSDGGLLVQAGTE